MSSKEPDLHQNGRREIATAVQVDPVESAIEGLRPLLRPEKADQARIVLTRAISKVHSGPIPSAEEMEHLERIQAGSADRCFRMAEKEQDHRHACDRDIIGKEFSFRGRGQVLCMFTVILLLGAVAYIAHLGDTKAAASLGSVTLVGLVSAWLGARYIENKPSDSDDGTESPKPRPQQQTKGKKGRR